MAQNLKPIIDELKAKLQNRDEIRDLVLENLKQTATTVEKTIRQVADQAKDSRIVNDYVIPLVESEQADQAMKFLNDKLGTNPIVSRIEKARKTIIEMKVSAAKPAEVVEVETTVEAAGTVETVVKTTVETQATTTPTEDVQAAPEAVETATETKTAKKKATKTPSESNDA